MAKDITLSVSINLINSGSVDSDKKIVISKAIRKFRLNDTWFDVFNAVVESCCKKAEFPENWWDGHDGRQAFQTCADVTVTSSTNDGDIFNASPNAEINVLHYYKMGVNINY